MAFSLTGGDPDLGETAWMNTLLPLAGCHRRMSQLVLHLRDASILLYAVHEVCNALRQQCADIHVILNPLDGKSCLAWPFQRLSVADVFRDG